MPVTVVRLIRSRMLPVMLWSGSGPLLDEYLEFLAGRCRPNTVLAVAYDLKVFFTAVGKTPRRVRPVDVLAFMTAQRTGGKAACRWPGRTPAGCRPGRCGGGCRACRGCMGSCRPAAM